MHGLDHVILFDHGSTDNSYRELEPWLKSGFVTIFSNITEMIEDMPYRAAIKRKGEFEYLMQGKAHLEKVYLCFIHNVSFALIMACTFTL